jgi:hypothetical protein
MKKPHLRLVLAARAALGASVLLWMGNGVAVADEEYRVDVQYGGTWRDAEKRTATSRDDLLCWAAPAANMLAWTGWGIGGAFKDEDDIFAFLFEHLSDSGLDSPREAWRLWFTGQAKGSDGHVVGTEGTGWWPDVEFPQYQWESPKGALFRGLGCKMIERDPLSLKGLLDDGYGVVVQIVCPRPDGGRQSHMISLWGYTHTGKDPFTGIVYSDSDDDKQRQNPREAENRLCRSPVHKGPDGMWWFEYGDAQWQMIAAYALARKPE